VTVLSGGVAFTETELAAETFLQGEADTPPVEITKVNGETRAWLATLRQNAVFVKFVPTALYESRARKEIAIAGGRLHPAIIPLRRVVACPDGVLLLYDRAEGETLADSEARARFCALPLAEKLPALNILFDGLAAICDAGWVLVDVYEGNIMYDNAARRIHLFDFDLSEQGDGFALAMERNYGSSRLMAPEEFQKGAWIDQRTNVFNLGRIATLALGEEAPPALCAVLDTATRAERMHRYATVREFALTFALGTCSTNRPTLIGA
jgi:serine/threonine-protein kinase